MGDRPHLRAPLHHQPGAAFSDMSDDCLAPMQSDRVAEVDSEHEADDRSSRQAKRFDLEKNAHRRKVSEGGRGDENWGTI